MPSARPIHIIQNSKTDKMGTGKKTGRTMFNHMTIPDVMDNIKNLKTFVPL